MVSPELLRRFQFFAGLKPDHLTALAKAADETPVPEGHSFFHEGDTLDMFYLVLDGEVSILIELPEKQQEIVVSTITPVDIFAWSALIPPHTSTAGAKATKACHIVAFDCEKLHPVFERDAQFAFIMTQRAAQGFRSRLADMRLESLAYVADQGR